MTDRFTVHAVVIGLVVIVLCALAAVVIIELVAHSTNEVAASIATTGLGALASLLARTSAQDAPQGPPAPLPGPPAGPRLP